MTERTLYCICQGCGVVTENYKAWEHDARCPTCGTKFIEMRYAHEMAKEDK